METTAAWRVWAQVAVVSTTFILAAARPMPFVRIVAAYMALMIAYGMLQDQFSARYCPEYFTVGHPPIEGVTDPTIMGLAWGFLGSWPGGMALGVALACPMLLGRAPPLTLRQVAGPLALLFVVMAATTVLIGLATHHNAKVLQVALGEPWASHVPPERHRAMFVVANMNFVTYTTAILGGVVLSVWAGVTRQRESTAGATVSGADSRHRCDDLAPR